MSVGTKQLVAWLMITLALSACDDPEIRSLDPISGPAGSLVEIKGDTLGSTVQWDAGSATEQQAPGGFLGSHIFTVPRNASSGVHQVQLKRGTKTGNLVPFNVTVSVPFGPPRLDRVSIASAEFLTGNKVNPWLYVQGANVDTGAEVLINGTVVPTVAHKGIRNNLIGVNPEDLKYPIFHYLAFLASPGSMPTASTITVQLRNVNGQASNKLQYQMPRNASTMDSDGDDLPDTWEENGYDANGDGVIDIDLKALGADPHRPDIFVEVDIMESLTNPPSQAVWTAVRDSFANAPIINPSADNGINITLDTTGTVPYFDEVNFHGADTATFANFYTLKGSHFDNSTRGRIYHYSIWANGHPLGWSGVSDVDWINGGDDFIVSFDEFPTSYQSVRLQAATFMHELGHNLNQKHGGSHHGRHNPVYSSVMSYSWQLRTGHNDFFSQIETNLCAILLQSQFRRRK